MARRKRMRKASEVEKDVARRARNRPDTVPAEVASGHIGLPSGRGARSVRETLFRQVQRKLGNRATQRRLAAGRGGNVAYAVLQRQDEDEVEQAPAVNPGGRGPGQVTGARETYYEVSGATLDDVSPQLNHFDGYAAETSADLGMDGRVTPERVDDMLQVEVNWVVTNVTVGLPQWADYDAACPAAQQEWDRFMRQTRIHEQSAHVDAANEFLEELGSEDKVITGENVEELQQNLQAKRDELGERLQAIHDACDHGVAIDAILHPENGRCVEETEIEETGE